MKKYLSFIIVLVVSLFIGSDKVFGETHIVNSCLYEGSYKQETDDGFVEKEFQILVNHFSDNDSKIYYLSDHARLTPFESHYAYEDRIYRSYDNWEQELIIWGGELDGEIASGDVISDHGCFNYMFWGIYAAADLWYLSDNSNEFDNLPKFDGDIIYLLELREPYQKTGPKAVLEELVCTYMAPPETHADFAAHSYEMPRNIIYKIVPTSNNLYEYTLIVEEDGEYRKIFSGEVSTDYKSFVGTITSEVVDVLNPRIFQYDDGHYWACPSQVMVGYTFELNEVMIPNPLGFYLYKANLSIGFPTNELDPSIVNKEGNEELYNALTQIMSIVEDSDNKYSYSLSKNSSYIDHSFNASEVSDVCIYGREDEIAESGDNWLITIQEQLYDNGNYEYQVIYKDETLTNIRTPNVQNIQLGLLINGGCDALPEIYTNCFTTSGNFCAITSLKFGVYEKLVQNTTMQGIDGSTIEAAMAYSNGRKYKQLICELGDRLKVLTSSNVSVSLRNTVGLTFYDEIGENPVMYSMDNIAYQSSSSGDFCESTWGISTNYECSDLSCQNNIDYTVERKIREISSYCNDVHDDYSKDKILGAAYVARVEECIQFDKFYSSLVSAGIINSLFGNCDIGSEELLDLIHEILDIIKIAGPLIAIGLGMVDFAKAVVSGDADKELKQAANRFFKRIIAAIILLLLPIILSFIMNIFLKNKSGYNPNNPFCDMVEWSEVEQEMNELKELIKPSEQNPSQSTQ